MSFYEANELLRQFQAMVVQRSLTPEGFDVAPAVALGHKLIAVVDNLGPTMVRLTDGRLMPFCKPHVVFSKTCLTAALMDNTVLELPDHERLPQLAARMAVLPEVEYLEADRSVR